MTVPADPIPDFHPATQQELSRWLADNAAGAAQSVFVAGGRTSLHFGNPSEKTGRTLCTTSLDRIIDYPARDMTVTVEAGLRIDRLQNLLRTERQRLALDVPQAHRATLGGALASNANGSRRYGLGTIRDYVLGLSAVDAGGRSFKSGGRVVKNVAGYDLCKMLIGSLGTLAVVSQVTLKLRPLPESSALLWAELPQVASAEPILARLVHSAARPVSIDLFNRDAAADVTSEAGLSLPTASAVLCLGVEGTSHETEWQIATLEDEIHRIGSPRLHRVLGAEAEPLWMALTEFQSPSDDPATFKASVPPSATVALVELASKAGCRVQAYAGSGIVIGHLPDSVTSVKLALETVLPLRQQAERLRGSLVMLECDESWKKDLPVFGAPTPAFQLMRKLKRQLDPAGLLNPRRLFGDL